MTKNLDMDAVIEGYLSGMSTNELGALHGVNGATIHRRLQALGLSRTVAEGNRLRLSRTVRPGSVGSLAADLGMDVADVAALLIKHGFVSEEIAT